MPEVQRVFWGLLGVAATCPVAWYAMPSFGVPVEGGVALTTMREHPPAERASPMASGDVERSSRGRVALTRIDPASGAPLATVVRPLHPFVTPTKPPQPIVPAVSPATPPPRVATSLANVAAAPGSSSQLAELRAFAKLFGAPGQDLARSTSKPTSSGKREVGPGSPSRPR